jgi:predicted HicB family RNase H-like nuclease
MSPLRGPMIHVRLDEDTHRELKVIVAKQGTTIQQLVSELIQKEVARAKE